VEQLSLITVPPPTSEVSYRARYEKSKLTPWDKCPECGKHRLLGSWCKNIFHSLKAYQ
jgi:hypothetical protein